MTKKNSGPLNIILLGDPASGKSTHGRLLAKEYHLHDIDIGDELRKLQKKASHRERIGAIDKGNLASTSIVRDIIAQQITQTPPDTGVLFAGSPKMVGEAKLIARLFKQYGRDRTLVMYLTIPHKEMHRRIDARTEYIDGHNQKRLDDTDMALKNRLKYYKTHIQAVVNFLKKEYAFKTIETVDSKRAVHGRIRKEINKFIGTL